MHIKKWSSSNLEKMKKVSHTVNCEGGEVGGRDVQLADLHDTPESAALMAPIQYHFDGRDDPVRLALLRGRSFWQQQFRVWQILPIFVRVLKFPVNFRKIRLWKIGTAWKTGESNLLALPHCPICVPMHNQLIHFEIYYFQWKSICLLKIFLLLNANLGKIRFKWKSLKSVT